MRWRNAFAQADDLLNSHRGWDIGAPDLMKALTPEADAVFCGDWSRLLIDLNRSETHPKCFSEISKRLPHQELIETIHRPFRRGVADAVGQFVDQGRTVLHLSVHTFTPVLNGRIRNADYALLYDPARALEKDFAAQWGEELARIGRFRRNYPYRGIADGHTTALRKAFPPDHYIGIELEVNQSISARTNTATAVANSLMTVIHAMGAEHAADE